MAAWRAAEKKLREESSRYWTTAVATEPYVPPEKVLDDKGIAELTQLEERARARRAAYAAVLKQIFG